MIEIRFFSPSEFETLKEYWIELEKGKDMTAFQRYSWYYALNKQYLDNCFGAFDKAVYVVAFSKGNPIMIAPIHIKKYGFEFKGYGSASGAYVIGTWGFTDYLNYIYCNFNPEAFEAINKAIKNKYKIKALHINSVRRRTEIQKYLSNKYSDSFCYETLCVKTEPKDNFDIFFKSMSKSTRQNIRTALNREIKDGKNIYIKVFNTVSKQDAEEFFSIYLERSKSKNTINIQRDGLKNSILKELNKIYNIRLKESLKKSNYLVYNMVHNPDSMLVGIYCNEKKIGFLYGLKSTADLWHDILVCFDENYRFYSPCRTALYRLYKDYVYSSDRNKMTIDMTKGNEKYKYDFCGKEHFVDSYVI